VGQLSKYRGLIAVGVLGIVVLTLLWMLAVPGQQRVAQRSLSAFEAGSNGLRALYLLGRRMNLNVSLGTTPLDLLTGAGTVVIGPEDVDLPFPGQPEFTEKDIWKLLDRGTDVLYLAPVPAWQPPESGDEASPPDMEPADSPEEMVHRSLDDEELGTQPEGSSQSAVAGQRIALEKGEQGAVTFHVGEIDSEYFAGATTLRVSEADMDSDRRWNLWKSMASGAQEVYWLGDTGKPLLAVYQGPRGKLVALFVSEILTNGNIGNADNVVLGYNLLKESDSPLGTYFLESIHGHHRSSVGLTNLLVFTSWGRLLVLAAIAVLIALMQQVFPLGRKRVAPRDRFPSPLERVHALAQLWRRGKMFVPAMRFALACTMLGESEAGKTPQRLRDLLRNAGGRDRSIQAFEETLMGKLRPTGSQRSEMIRLYARALSQRGPLQPYI